MTPSAPVAASKAFQSAGTFQKDSGVTKYVLAPVWFLLSVLCSMKDKMKEIFAPIFALFESPNANTWVAIISNFIILVIATFIPRLYNDNGFFDEWLKVQNPSLSNEAKYNMFVSAGWLVAMNISSLCSIFVVNKDASSNKMLIARDSSLPHTCSDSAKALDKKLNNIWLFTLIIVFVILGHIGLLLAKPSGGIIHYMYFFSGAIYMILVSINDFFGHSCVNSCKKIKEEIQEEFRRHPIIYSGVEKESEIYYHLHDREESRNNLLVKIDDIVKDLSFFSRIIAFIDIPILMGLSIIYIQEYTVLPHGLFREGFATGALAMHIIAANLISIVIGMYIFEKKQILQTT